MENEQYNILEKISLVAKSKGFTLTDIERECGFPKSSMRKWSENVPSILKVKKVADFLEVTIDYLVNDVEIFINVIEKRMGDSQMFWDIYLLECEKHGEKPHAVLKKLGISSGSVVNWKKGVVPSGEILHKVANYFGVTIEYLVGDDEIAIKPSVKKTFFKTLLSLVQRWTSLRCGVKVSSEQLFEIVKYVNCDIRFICNEQVADYTPAEEYDKRILQNLKVLFDILDIMDRCADSDEYRALQIQLSRIVLYWLNKKEYTQDVLLQSKELDMGKLQFLYTNVPNKDVTLNYGLNFTDLAVLREKTGCSYQYMFTGVED